MDGTSRYCTADEEETWLASCQTHVLSSVQTGCFQDAERTLVRDIGEFHRSYGYSPNVARIFEVLRTTLPGTSANNLHQAAAAYEQIRLLTFQTLQFEQPFATALRRQGVRATGIPTAIWLTWCENRQMRAADCTIQALNDLYTAFGFGALYSRAASIDATPMAEASRHQNVPVPQTTISAVF